MLSIFNPGSVGAPAWPVVFTSESGGGTTPPDEITPDPQGVPAFE